MIQAPGLVYLLCLHCQQDGLGLIWFLNLFTVLIPSAVLVRVADSALDAKLHLQVLDLCSMWAAFWQKVSQPLLPLLFLDKQE